jgi:hypothetical protein
VTGSKLLAKIEADIKEITISLEEDTWRKDIPSRPGWYFFKTDTPIEILKKVGPPPIEGRHYHLPEKITTSLTLREYQLCIEPKTRGQSYIVYSGEAKNLSARAREHFSGHPKTGCLALTNYPVLAKYKWWFRYAECQFGNNPNDSKLIRTYGEQLWRAKYGWPILCGK